MSFVRMHLLVAGLIGLEAGTALLAQENIAPMRRHDTTVLRFDADKVLGSTLKSGGVSFGTTKTLTLGMDFLTPVWHSGRWQWDLGMEWKRREIDYRVNPGAPGVLQVFSMPVVASYEWNEVTTLSVKLNPGIYSDMEDLGLSDVNVPVGIRLYHEYATEVLWFAGIQVDPFNEIPVIPDFGVRWRFWYDWVLDFGLPNPRIEYDFNDDWTGSVGLEWRGGAYRVSEVLPSSGGRAGTGDSTLTYRDFRVKAGLRYAWDEDSFLVLAGGYSLHRRFKFGDGNYQLTTGGAPFVQALFQSSW